MELFNSVELLSRIQFAFTVSFHIIWPTKIVHITFIFVQILGQQKEGFALCNSGKDTLFKLHNNNDLGCHKTILSFVLEHIRNLRRINWSRGTYQILKKEVVETCQVVQKMHSTFQRIALLSILE